MRRNPHGCMGSVDCNHARLKGAARSVWRRLRVYLDSQGLTTRCQRTQSCCLDMNNLHPGSLSSTAEVPRHQVHDVKVAILNHRHPPATFSNSRGGSTLDKELDCSNAGVRDPITSHRSVASGGRMRDDAAHASPHWCPLRARPRPRGRPGRRGAD